MEPDALNLLGGRRKGDLKHGTAKPTGPPAAAQGDKKRKKEEKRPFAARTRGSKSNGSLKALGTDKKVDRNFGDSSYLPLVLEERPNSPTRKT